MFHVKHFDVFLYFGLFIILLFDSLLCFTWNILAFFYTSFILYTLIWFISMFHVKHFGIFSILCLFIILLFDLFLCFTWNILYFFLYFVYSLYFNLNYFYVSRETFCTFFYTSFILYTLIWFISMFHVKHFGIFSILCLFIIL